MESPQQSYQEVIYSNLYGKLKFKETENLSKTIFHLSVGGELQTDQPSSKPCSCHEGHQVPQMFTESRRSLWWGFQVRLLESPVFRADGSGFLSEASTEPRVYSSGCHGFRVFQRTMEAAIGLSCCGYSHSHWSQGVPATDLRIYGFCGTLVPRRVAAKASKGVTVLVPSCLFLGLPKVVWES